MTSVTHSLERAAVKKMTDRIFSAGTEEKRSLELKKLITMLKDYMSGNDYEMRYDHICRTLTDPDNTALCTYINRAFEETDHEVLRTFLMNFGYEVMGRGRKLEFANMKKHGCNIPWLMLIDPTSACNLHCKGCWASEYGKSLNLTYEELTDVIEQGKKLGTYLYMFTGGEPLMRRKDVLKLCETHSDCQFLAYTNGTLVDEELCLEMKRVKNLALAISVEGSPDTNDARRGEGIYEKVMNAMSLLKKHGLIFGVSICYTNQNCEAVSDRDFIRLLTEKGCRFALYFHYMPAGSSASADLLPSAEQRLHMKKRTREIRDPKTGEGLFTMDFQNDGEFVGGCIAGGRRYFHVNAKGDAEPCVFIHYSDANIKTHTLLEILKQPLFMAYHNNQPFNENHFRPCAMLENPEILPRLIRETGAVNTDMLSAESPEQLCEKCTAYAEKWKPCAEKLWNSEEH